MNAHPYRRIEAMLSDFDPDFAFAAPLPMRFEALGEHVCCIRREAILASHDDALNIRAGSAGWFHASDLYLRHVCAWVPKWHALPRNRIQCRNTRR